MLKPEFTGNASLIEDPDLMGPILSRKSWWIDQFPNLANVQVDCKRKKETSFKNTCKGL